MARSEAHPAVRRFKLKRSKAAARPSLSRWAQKLSAVIAFGVATAGAVPQYKNWVFALVNHLPFQESPFAKRQLELWSANSECYKVAHPVQVTTAKNEAVSVTVCPSGDLLVTVQPAGPGAQQVNRWIEMSSIRRSDVALVSPSDAYAEGFGDLIPVQVQGETPVAVLCQRMDGNLVLRRVRYANGQCFDQWINPLTGVVDKYQSAPCNDSCQ